MATLYFYMGEKYVDQWQDYLSDQMTCTVHLNSLPAVQTRAIRACRLNQ